MEGGGNFQLLEEMPKLFFFTTYALLGNVINCIKIHGKESTLFALFCSAYVNDYWLTSHNEI